VWKGALGHEKYATNWWSIGQLAVIRVVENIHQVLWTATGRRKKGGWWEVGFWADYAHAETDVSLRLDKKPKEWA
jgi:hypothetical protein